MAYSLLCLGDSYTIGESVALHESFPYQTVQKLRRKNLDFNAPEIIAKTGWTSLELIEHLNDIELPEKFDFVTLLLGVNNQYRGLSQKDFSEDFEKLVNTSISFVEGNAQKVKILSIPDWGVTPFAKERDVKKISDEIDAYNNICFAISKKYKAQFINITESTRKAANNLSLLTTDQLHYSKLEYEIWANLVSNNISKTI